jgi:hypothetical protein
MDFNLINFQLENSNFQINNADFHISQCESNARLAKNLFFIMIVVTLVHITASFYFAFIGEVISSAILFFCSLMFYISARVQMKINKIWNKNKDGWVTVKEEWVTVKEEWEKVRTKIQNLQNKV